MYDTTINQYKKSIIMYTGSQGEISLAHAYSALKFHTLSVVLFLTAAGSVVSKSCKTARLYHIVITAAAVIRCTGRNVWRESGVTA